MTSDAMTRLEAAIAASAVDRDQKEAKSRDEQAAKVQQQERARAIWAMRREQLPGVVARIDGMLRGNGFHGLVMGKFDLKHSDIERAVIEFRHNAHSSSKILLCATSGGDFTCSITSTQGDTGSTELQLEDLSEERLEEAVAHAVEACLSGRRMAKPD